MFLSSLCLLVRHDQAGYLEDHLPDGGQSPKGGDSPIEFMAVHEVPVS